MFWHHRLVKRSFLISHFSAEFVPKLQPKLYNFAGLHFSDKSSTYLLLLVVLGRDLRTLNAFMPGFFFGFLFGSTPFSKLRLPSFLCSIFSIFSPFFEVVPTSMAAIQRQRRLLEAQRRMGTLQQRQGHAGRAQGQGQGQAGGHGYRDQLLPGAGGMGGGMGLGVGGMGMGAGPRRGAPSPPPEDAIQQLMALGFDRDRSIQALQTTNNNVEAAANRLLNGL